MWVEGASLSVFLNDVQLVQNELMIFALFWFVIGAIDEIAIDLVWLWLRLTGRVRTPCLPADAVDDPLNALSEEPLAVFFPAWREAEVIGTTLAHALRAWPQSRLRVYVGCYVNDPATQQAALAGAGGDPRVRLVLIDRPGPTTKADCLNRLHAELLADERREGMRFRGVILQDAEDMVHPAALALVARALAEFDFVQLPVRPEPQRRSRWVAGHYSDEFAETHAKTMVVRDALGAAIPAAGVGCAFGRDILDALAVLRRKEGESGPFAAECLTEDYELGWLIARLGGRSRFLRVRDAQGELVATRACFPPTLPEAERQKARWIHGIAFQSWDRLGWSRRPLDIWMALHDRRGPLTALVLAVAYLWILLAGLLLVARAAGWQGARPVEPLMAGLLQVGFAALAWRLTMRLVFTWREYGPIEALRSPFRAVVGNVIAIFACSRAIVAYLRTLRGGAVEWDKTEHRDHPAAIQSAEIAA